MSTGEDFLRTVREGTVKETSRRSRDKPKAAKLSPGRGGPAHGESAGGVTEEQVVPPPTDPMQVARMFVNEHYTHDTGPTLLRHHRGDFYTFNGSYWPEAEDRRIRADLYRWLESARYEKPVRGVLVKTLFAPTKAKLDNIIDALKAVGHLDQGVAPPAWLDDSTEQPAAEMVAMSNGLLHLPSRTLIPHTPHFFSHHALPFAFDLSAPPPSRWLRFLHEVWGDDVESISTLSEVMGYVLGGSTSLQKLFMLIGPKRSGKGTIGRVLTGLLGAHNVAAPTLASLATNFGLQPLIDKPLALISDARLGTRVDGTVAVERLLSISGEDSLTVDRKYKEPWTGRLPSRVLILTNELPRFTDSSTALASRFVLLTMNTSFYGREDPGLTASLLAEATGIFLWALEGLDRLNKRGYFVQPSSANEALHHLEDLSSPTWAFVRDRCDRGPAFVVDKDEVYQAWKSWCQEEGRDRPGTKIGFGRDLRAAVPSLREIRRRDGENRPRAWQGLRLQAQRGGPWTIRDRAGGRDASVQESVQDEVRDESAETSTSAAMVQDGPGSSPPMTSARIGVEPQEQLVGLGGVEPYTEPVLSIPGIAAAFDAVIESTDDPPDAETYIRQRLTEGERNYFVLAMALRARGYPPPDGYGTWTAVAVEEAVRRLGL